MRIVFAGTSDFSATILRALIKSRHNIAAAISQPDRPKGRHMKIEPTPVKELSLSVGLTVLQPQNLNDPEFHDALKAISPEAIVVAAYGKILPKWLLDMPPYGCLNVHASLLPRYRGAAPIRRAIMDGESTTGVSIMLVEEELDAGPVFEKVAIDIEPEDNAGTISLKLADIGAEALLKVLDDIELHHLKPEPQNASLSTYADKIEKDDYWLDWASPATVLTNKIRALAPAPGARTHLKGSMIKILRAVETADTATLLPGGIKIVSGRLLVAAADRFIEVLEVQPENRPHMDAQSWLRGQKIEVGAGFTA